jgi:hypothetical protein
MAMSFNSALEYVKDKISLGEIDASQANVFIVKLMGVRLITSKVPVQVRKSLNEAVKSGELGHLRKEGHLPEAYFHKNARARAVEERNKYAKETLEAVLKVCI